LNSCVSFIFFILYIHLIHQTQNSIYALFPFFTPDHMKESMTKRGLQAKYIFGRPNVLSEPRILNTLTGIKAAFNDPSKFKVIYEKYGYGSALMFDDPEQYVVSF